MKKKKTKSTRCSQCGGELTPSECGCMTKSCPNHVSKWPKPGTFYAPAKDSVLHEDYGKDKK